MDQPELADLVDHVARTDVLQIATERQNGEEVVTPIWGVVVDGMPYIRSAYGPGSFWYRRAQRTHRAALVDGDRRYPVAIEDVDDEATLRKVDRAYAEKYAGHGTSLQEVIAPDVRRFTMRLTPAR
jgi:hypothetical protein